MAQAFFETIPMWAVYLLVVAFFLLACELGFHLGRLYRRWQPDKEAVASVGPLVGGLLGMMAFMLGFAFSIASNQHGTRRENVLNEANIIGTAYLRADLLPPERGERVRRLLREYVDMRLAAVQPGADLQQAMQGSSRIHEQLWAEVSATAREQRDDISALNVESINALIDMHETRVTGGVRARIPSMVWLGLAGITFLTMLSVGLQLGLNGNRRQLAVGLLSLAFACLITLIVDLNRPQGGLITVGQQAMLNLQQSMKGGPPGD
jgi:hypothetical protein